MYTCTSKLRFILQYRLSKILQSDKETDQQRAKETYINKQIKEGMKGQNLQNKTTAKHTQPCKHRQTGSSHCSSFVYTLTFSQHLSYVLYTFGKRGPFSNWGPYCSFCYKSPVWMPKQTHTHPWQVGKMTGKHKLHMSKVEKQYRNRQNKYCTNHRLEGLPKNLKACQEAL